MKKNGLRVAVIGSGGREDAIAWAMRYERRVGGVYVIPGNGGIAGYATTFPEVSDIDAPAIIKVCKDQRIDHVIVGPEAPLVAGLVDELRKAKISVCGPTRGAAVITEGSKLACMHMLKNASVPIPDYGSAQTYDSGRLQCDAYFNVSSAPLVIKADGLCAGKGVRIARDFYEAQLALDDFMVKKIFGEAGSTVVFQRFLQGWEISVIIATDGQNYHILPPARDYKRALDGDKGENTGGMGAYCPDPNFSAELRKTVENEIVKPTLAQLEKKLGAPYSGFLYFGLMITSTGPVVLELNCRLGDPETQVILPRLISSFLDLTLGAANGNIGAVAPEWDQEAFTVGVVLASDGYPKKPKTGFPIDVDGTVGGNSIVYQAGVKSVDCKLITSGGRVCTVVGVSSDYADARRIAYLGADKIQFEGKWYRSDIAANL